MAETSGGLAQQLLVDSQLWHACAGAISHLPRVGSSVVYFPQGHAEQVPGPLPLDLPRVAPAIACKVLRIDFLADTETDEAYARVHLHPVSSPWLDDADGDYGDDSDGGIHDSSVFSESKPLSFAKTLTQSDANNGGGFSIPRYCAETIFPQLDYTQTPPVQMVLAKDIHGTVWRFRHIYRGTPRRHLLTTGWSNFVNQKKLVAGDVIVFMRTSAGELCIGIRRVNRSLGQFRAPPGCGLKAGTDQDLQVSEMSKGPPALAMSLCNRSSTFSRHRSTITPQSVLEAITAASSGHPFDVVYYPRSTCSEFCVKAHLVKRALQRSWAPGMRFKMAIETDDASRTSWYMGTILKVEEVDPVHWLNSPWKVLQVTWDEGVLQGIDRVNPWQIDLVSPILLPPLSLPRKKSRLLESRVTQLDGHDSSTVPFASPMAGYTHSWHEFTAGLYCSSMEGARHSPTIYGHALQDAAPSDWSCDSSHRLQSLQPEAARSVYNLGLGLPEATSRWMQDHQLTTVTVGSSTSNSEPALSTNISCCGDEGGSSSPKCTQFLLFGKAIDISEPATAQHLDPLPKESVENRLRKDTASDGLQSEVSLSGQGSSVEIMEAASHFVLQQGESISLTSTLSNGNPHSA